MPGNAVPPGASPEPANEAAETRKNMQAFLHAIMDNSTAVIYMKDRDGRFVLINKHYEKRFNVKREEVIGKSDYDLFPRELADRLRENDKKMLESGSVAEFEEKALEPDGALHTYISIKFPIPGMPGAVCGISTDITDKKRIEEELFKARKLDSLGVLAGGIAHDFNNLLLGILGNVSIAKTELQSGKTALKELDRIEKAAIKAKGLAKLILTFSKGGEPIRETSQIEDILRSSAELTLKGSNARCEFKLSENLWAADVDESQIAQVFNNILLNAAHSMPSGGLISVEAANFTSIGDGPLPIKEGNYVRVSIRDEGCGISEKDIGRIFDPFFTTKQKASGLGLSLTYSIVRKHDGYICAESELGKGSVFYVYLPAVKKDSLIDKPTKTALLGGRILVMDDEELVRDVMGSMLRNLGHEAVFAMNGAEAVDLFRNAKEAGKPFDAVILDLTLPGDAGGNETMKKLLKIDPSIRGIVSSGYSKDPVMSGFRKYGFKAAIAKPFRVSEFSTVIKNVLADEA